MSFFYSSGSSEDSIDSDFSASEDTVTAPHSPKKPNLFDSPTKKLTILPEEILNYIFALLKLDDIADLNTASTEYKNLTEYVKTAKMAVIELSTSLEQMGQDPTYLTQPLSFDASLQSQSALTRSLDFIRDSAEKTKEFQQSFSAEYLMRFTTTHNNLVAEKLKKACAKLIEFEYLCDHIHKKHLFSKIGLCTTLFNAKLCELRLAEACKSAKKQRLEFPISLTLLNLTQFPPEFIINNLPLLQNLERIDFQNCTIANLPAEIKELKKLKTLILNDNNLVSLPVELLELSDLSCLEVIGNRLSVESVDGNIIARFGSSILIKQQTPTPKRLRNEDDADDKSRITKRPNLKK